MTAKRLCLRATCIALATGLLVNCAEAPPPAPPAGTITGPSELSAALVFTTQSTWETSADIAGQIRELSFDYRALDSCSDEGNYRLCQGEFDAWDFRVDGRAVDDANPQPQAQYTLKITTWLPPEGVSIADATAPYPTLIFGHGLSSGRSQARKLARFAAPS